MIIDCLLYLYFIGVLFYIIIMTLKSLTTDGYNFENVLLESIFWPVLMLFKK